MSRTAWNLIIDLAAGCLFLAMVATGYILRFPLPPKTNKTLTLWGMSRHTWGTVHFWISLGLLTVLLVHVVLHWQWIVSVLSRRLHLPSLSRLPLVHSGLAVVLVLALTSAFFAWIVHQNVKSIADRTSDGGPRKAAPTSGAGEQNEGVEQRPRIDFETDVDPLLRKRCLLCHGPGKQAGGIRVDRRSDFFEARGTSPFVVPGRSTESVLIEIVSGSQKDLRFAEIHKLSEDEVSLLKAWIDAGAEWPTEPNP